MRDDVRCSFGEVRSATIHASFTRDEELISEKIWFVPIIDREAHPLMKTGRNICAVLRQRKSS
jgi:hypothetical protein